MATFPFELPLPWLWSCHHCHARYPLGATRRCLHDGHYFCGGTTVSALTGKTIKRHKACGSEFDYIGWEDVSRWRKCCGGGTMADRPKQRRGCEDDCEYPSECHHRVSHLAVRTSSKVAVEEVFAASKISTSNSDATNATGLESFLDPSFFEIETSPPEPEAVETEVLSAFPNLKSTELMTQKMIKSTKSNAQAATHSSTTADRTIARDLLRPARSAPPRPLSSSPPALFTVAEPIGARASAHELGLIIPSLDPSLNLPSLFSPDSSSSSSDATMSEEASSEPPTSEEEAERKEEEEEERENHQNLPPRKRNNRPTLPRKKPHIGLRLFDDMDSPPDIDMTDYIPGDSPTSPLSPGFSSWFLTTTDAAAAATAHSGGGLLTPKSPESPTNNPLFRYGEDNLPKQEERMMPPSPLSPRRRNAWDWSRADEEEEEDGEGEKEGAGSEKGLLTAAPVAMEGVSVEDGGVMDLGRVMRLGPLEDAIPWGDDAGSDVGAGVGAVDRRVSV